MPPNVYIGPVWQGSGSSENGSGSGSSEGATPLEELKPFWKTFGKTAPSVFVEWMEEGECPYCPCFNLVVHMILDVTLSND